MEALYGRILRKRTEMAVNAEVKMGQVCKDAAFLLEVKSIEGFVREGRPHSLCERKHALSLLQCPGLHKQLSLFLFYSTCLSRSS